MDVRCEKCQTEYELDESRLKPGGVTVKCTNCGHMFKIRKRSNTNVGVATASSVAAAAAAAPPPAVDRARPPSKPGAPPVVISPSSARQHSRAESEAPVNINDAPSGPNSERQWLVRLENGETKTCRELATLQQWIVAGVVGRESLISRTGKTWKRLGDIAELGQYFIIADEARAQRAHKPTGKAAAAATMLGVGPGPQGDEDEDRRSTGNFRARPKTPPPPPPKANPMAQTELSPASGPIVQQPKTPSGPVPTVKPAPTNPPPKPAVPAGRETAGWAAADIKATDSMAAMPQGPRGGKLAAGHDEPAFAGRVRVEPSDRSTFDGKITTDDVDDDVYPSSRGSRAGMWIALISLLVIGAAAGAVYMFVFNKKTPAATAAAPSDAAVQATAPSDAQAIATAPADAHAEVPAANPLDAARAELVAGVHARMKSTVEGLAGKDDPSSLAIRARLWTALAQGMQDRAAFVDKAEADKLRKEAKQIVVDAAPLAQRAFNGQADNADANLAMADVLRLQGKPAPSVKRYLATAKSKAATDKHILASVALGEAQLSLRDGKLPDAQAALAATDAPADDMRIKLELALVAYAQNKSADAKAQIDQILATQPDHDAALAMYKKLETVVTKTDPLPPEDGGGTTTKPPTNTGGATTNNGGGTTANNGGGTTANNGGGGGGGGGNDYDSVLARANKLAETSCAKAMDLFTKALEQKPNGVEALTGMGYCHLDSKQFSSAFSKFRAALAVSPRFEPALGGIAETYQRQGNKEAAVEAWKRYLEVFPASPKAKKQLELLGVTDGAGGGGGGGGSTPKPEGSGAPSGGGGDDSSSAPAPTPPAPAAGSGT